MTVSFPSAFAADIIAPNNDVPKLIAGYRPSPDKYPACDRAVTSACRRRAQPGGVDCNVHFILSALAGTVKFPCRQAVYAYLEIIYKKLNI
ncbi:MAG: hypothetical protein HY056_05865 [Proteobacteria bacterium]|nr:hypothetical protein [Pseudomonadota bacterium]